MNMAALRSIEVIRGPVSSTYGSEAIGGAINFISLRPAAELRGIISQKNNLPENTEFFISSLLINKIQI